jgi:uncharacterized protein GlcG (DUF336 family)
MDHAAMTVSVELAAGKARTAALFKSRARRWKTRIELTVALGLTRSSFIEDRAPAALLHQIKGPLKKIEASSVG